MKEVLGEFRQVLRQTIQEELKIHNENLTRKVQQISFASERQISASTTRLSEEISQTKQEQQATRKELQSLREKLQKHVPANRSGKVYT